MYLAFGVVIAFGIFGLIVIDYLEYKLMRKQNEKLKKNINQYENTKAGALENDRIHQRTTIPKKDESI
jgi:hypothetical protein